MNNQYLTDAVLMVEPVSFTFNKETAINNFYQSKEQSIPSKQIQQHALMEFFALKKLLESNGIQVISIKDTVKPITPDAIFPNNWISFHSNKKAILYPMFAINRRKERRMDVFNILKTNAFDYTNVIDYTSFEKEHIFLEGTGAMMLDRKNKIAYCSLSKRADKELFTQFCLENDFEPVAFNSYQSINNKREPIYHTNVMMSVGNQYVMICLDAIDDVSQREMVKNKMLSSDKEIIYLTENQIANFAGNTLQLKGEKSTIIVISEQAKNSLTEKQIHQIEKYGKIVSVAIPTIEKFGGGSVRCMLAELF